MPTFVACENDEIEAWAKALGAQVIRGPESGLNRVVRHGVATLGASGYQRVLVAHADLADPRGLAVLAEWGGVVLVPDRKLDGTNAIIVPARSRFSFSYGPGSFARHLSEAERAGELHVINDNGLALDLDEPADLDAFEGLDTSANRPKPIER
jgi:2-phospho-L-lactate guanylyltransferase